MQLQLIYNAKFSDQRWPKIVTQKQRNEPRKSSKKKSALRSVFDPMYFKQLNAFYVELSLFKRSEKYIN